MKHIRAILWKQVKDTIKNKTILIQFVLFPVMTIIMKNSVKIEGMPEHYFALMFAVMFAAMAPLTSTASIIAEEKEKNTLRVLLMSNVKPGEYLIGISVYIWGMCMIGAGVIGLAGGFTGKALREFMILMAIGILVSTLIGAAIGTWSKNQIMATSITVPVMMVFSFIPMISMFNEKVSKAAEVLYSQQLQLMINQVGNVKWSLEPFAMIGMNFLIAVILFVVAYKRSGLE